MKIDEKDEEEDPKKEAKAKGGAKDTKDKKAKKEDKAKKSKDDKKTKPKDEKDKEVVLKINHKFMFHFSYSLLDEFQIKFEPSSTVQFDVLAEGLAAAEIMVPQCPLSFISRGLPRPNPASDLAWRLAGK